MNNYIYLIQTREFKNMNQNVYKIGKTKQDNLTRVNQYPKGSQLLLQQICSNCDILESLLIKDFKDKYIHRKDIGNEYFQGCCYEMIKDIHNKIITCMKDYKVEDKVEDNIDKKNMEENINDNQIKTNKIYNYNHQYKYICIICNTYYASYKSHWNHVKKFHKNINKKSLNCINQLD